MEIIQLNKPGIYRDYLLNALETGDKSLLKALRTGNDKERLVFLNTLQDLKEYQAGKSDCLILSKEVTDKLEFDWIASVLKGQPIKPPFGFISSMTEDEILTIYAKIEAEL